MKKFSSLRLGLGIAAFAASLILPSAKTFAAEPSIKINSNDVYVSSGSKSTPDGKHTYNADTKTLSIGASVSDIKISNIDITVKSTSASTVTQHFDVSNGSVKLTGDITIHRITLVDTDSTKQDKIEFISGANIKVSNGIVANYSYNTKTPGIVYDKSLCFNSDNADKITTTNKSGSYKTTTELKGSNITISSSNCSSDANPEIPETLDMIYVYVAIFMVSSAIFAYRRYLAKH